MFEFVKNYAMIYGAEGFCEVKKNTDDGFRFKRIALKNVYFSFYFSGTQGFQTLAASQRKRYPQHGTSLSCIF